MNTSATNTPEAVRGKLTDSPWFWVLIFSAMGLVLLQVFGAKYGRRQAQLERQHQARQRVQLDRADAPQEKLDEIRFSAEDNPVVSLGPLRIVLLVVMCVAGVVLRVSFRPQPREAHHDVAL